MKAKKYVVNTGHIGLLLQCGEANQVRFSEKSKKRPPGTRRTKLLSYEVSNSQYLCSQRKAVSKNQVCLYDTVKNNNNNK